MSYISIDAILSRLRNGVSPLSEGETKSILNYLVDQVNELSGQIKSLRGPEPSGSIEEEDTGSGVRRGRKPKQDSGKISQTSRDA